VGGEERVGMMAAGSPTPALPALRCCASGGEGGPFFSRAFRQAESRRGGAVFSLPPREAESGEGRGGGTRPALGPRAHG